MPCKENNPTIKLYQKRSRPPLGRLSMKWIMGSKRTSGVRCRFSKMSAHGTQSHAWEDIGIVALAWLEAPAVCQGHRVEGTAAGEHALP